MKLPTVPTNAVVEHLNTTYFHQIWNAPDDHGRANFQIYKNSTRIQTGAVPVGLSVVGLPTTDVVYAVYQSGYSVFGRFVTLPENQWINDRDFYLDHQITLSVFGGSGRVIPNGQSWFYYMPLRNQVLIAIDINYTSACIGESYPDLYMTVMKDTTRDTPIIANTYFIQNTLGYGTHPTEVMNAIMIAKTTYPSSTVVTINGWVWDIDHIPPLNPGDVVTIISDPDVIGYIDVPVDDNQTGYYSQKYGEYRELLHIPKSLNPTNIIFTTDTLTTVVYDSTTYKGVLGHRIDDHAVESITHNDFSMGRTCIQAFSQSLGAQNVFVRVFVRKPTNPNHLGEDVNHIKDLYSLSDLDIMKQLLGIDYKQIEEWKAPHLEQSGFLSLLYTFDGFKSDTVVPDYVAAMGYYDVASSLGQQMRYYTYKGAQVEIIKPARLHGYPCQAIVYANGIKIPEDQVGISNYKSNSFLLGFKAAAHIRPGDRIAVYIVEQDYRTPVPFHPTQNSPYILLDNSDYTLYQVISYDQSQQVWEGEVNKGYKRIPYSTADYTVTEQSDGKVKFEARSKHYGKDFYLIPKYGLNTATYDISTAVRLGNSLVIPLTTESLDETVIPLMGYKSMEVYLNGYRLIDGLDYVCSPIKGDNDDILQNLLTISNCDYLRLEVNDNYLEVAIHGDEIISEDKGYAIDNLLYRTAVPMIYTRPSSRVFVHGKLIETVSESGNIVTTGTPVDNGAPFLMQYMLSYGASKLMKDVSPNQDISLRTRIEKTLGIEEPHYPDTVVIDHLYALYSPFLAKITQDVGAGLFVIVDEPSDVRFIKQFKPYSPLLERDPVAGNDNPLIERQFVTLAAHYKNFAVTNPEQMIRLQRLIQLTLNPSVLSIKEVLI